MAGFLRRLLGRALRDERGAVSIIFVLFGGSLVAMSALAVDIGSVYLESRKLQGVADLAALAAAEDPGNARARVARVVADNGFGKKVYARIEIGTYVADPSLEAGRRFAPGGHMPNAVQVSLRTDASIFFGAAISGSEAITITRTATAANAQLASFSIGSRLVSLNGGVANALLSGLTGSSVSLSVMDYRSLLSAEIGLFDYISALRTELRLDAVSFNDILDTAIDTGDALKVLSRLLEDKRHRDAARAMRHIAVAASSLPSMKLARLIDPGVIGAQDRTSEGGMALNLNALDLTNAVLTLARGGRQVKLDLGAGVPGLASVQVFLAIGERPANSPWLAVTASGAPVIRTAQARLYLVAEVRTGVAGLASVTLPLFVELASAEARLAAIHCPADPRRRMATLEVRPGIGRAAIAEIDRSALDNFKRQLTEYPAGLVTLPTLRVTAQAGVKAGGESWQPLSFSAAEIDARAIRTASTRDALQSATATLVGDLKLKVSFLGIGIGLGESAVQKAVAAALGGAAAPIDQVVNALTGLLGLHLGEADLRINGLRCRATALVL